MNADTEIQSAPCENGKRKPHPVKFTVGNWLAFTGLALGVLGGGWKLLDRYQTKMDAKVATLEQKLVDQAQQNQINSNTKEDTQVQKTLATTGAVLANVKENVRRMMENQKNGGELKPVNLPTKVRIDLEKMLAPPLGDTP